MDNLVTIFQSFLAFLGPICVVLVTAWSERRRKRDAAIKKLEDEQRESKEKELMGKIDAIAEDVRSANEKVASLETAIHNLEQFDEESQENMKSLAQYYQLNSRYVHEVATLVMVLAEGMRDKHLDGNITQAIASYHQFEQKTLTSLMSTPQLND